MINTNACWVWKSKATKVTDKISESTVHQQFGLSTDRYSTFKNNNRIMHFLFREKSSNFIIASRRFFFCIVLLIQPSSALCQTVQILINKDSINAIT